MYFNETQLVVILMFQSALGSGRDIYIFRFRGCYYNNKSNLSRKIERTCVHNKFKGILTDEALDMMAKRR